MIRSSGLLFSAALFAASMNSVHAHDSAHIFDVEIEAFNRHYAKINITMEDDAIFLHGNHDHGPEWPVPGNTSADIIAELAAGFDNVVDDDENQARAASGFPQVVQPVSFINFYKKDGTGKRPYSDFQKQIDQLNRAYSGAEAKSGRYKSVRDSKIRFKLAGVRYVQNDDYFNYCALPSIIARTRPRYMMSPASHLNVYVCWCQNNLGLAWLPYDSWYRQNTDENHYALGAIVHHELLPGNNFKGGLWKKGNILTHEVGHCYGLKHPYEGGCSGGEGNSDGISDTPRMNGNPLATCRSLGNRDSCRGGGRDDLGNYMVATDDNCRNHFTPGQVTFMQNTIRKYKPTLMKSPLPSCVAAVDSTDASPDLQPCLDGTIQTAKDGRKFCRTDPDNQSVWGWACCPSGNNWENDACRKGNPSTATKKSSPPKRKDEIDPIETEPPKNEDDEDTVEETETENSGEETETENLVEETETENLVEETETENLVEDARSLRSA